MSFDESKEENNVSNYFSDGFENEQLFFVQTHEIEGREGKWHRWTLSLSTTNTSIIDPKTVSQVIYHLHPSFQPSDKIRKQPPFIVSCTGWGVFVVRATIKFKNYRQNIKTSHMLNFESPTTVTCVDSGRRYYYPTLHSHPLLKTKDEVGSNKKNTFVGTTGVRLMKSLLKMTPKLELREFRMRSKEFLICMRDAMDTNPLFKDIPLIPNSIFDIIGDYGLLKYPIRNIRPSQTVEIRDCHNCDVIIASPKVKNILIRESTGINLTFNLVLTQVEIHYSKDITTQCKGSVYTYKIEQSENVNINWSDDKNRVFIYSFDSPNTHLSVSNIDGINSNTQEIVLPTNDIPRISCRWRDVLPNDNNTGPHFTVKSFKPSRAHRF